MKRLLVAVALAAGLTAEAQPLTGGLLGRGGAYSSLPAPSTCTTAGQVPAFLGSPLALALGCDAGLTYDATTDTLTPAYIGAATLRRVGTGTASGRPSVTLCSWAGAAATTGTTEQALATCTIPANTLSVDYQALRVRAIYRTAANGNNKTMRIRLGGISGTSVASRGAAADNNSIVRLDAIVFRTGAATQTYDGSYFMYAAEGFYIGTDTQTLSNAIDIVVAGLTPTAAGDATLYTFLVEALN